MGAGITNGIIPSGGAAAAFRGALVKLTGAFSVTAAGGQQAVSWDAAVYDTDSIWSGGAPTRLTVPAGVTQVKLTGNVRWANSTANRSTQISLNGDPAANTEGLPMARVDVTNAEQNVHSAKIDVVGGDYFELELDTTTNLDTFTNNVWFAMEILK